MANVSFVVCFFFIITALTIIAGNGESDAYSCPLEKEYPSGVDKRKTNSLKLLLEQATPNVRRLTATVNSESPPFLPAQIRALFSKSCDDVCLIDFFDWANDDALISNARDIECSAELDTHNLPALCESFVISTASAGTDVYVTVPASIRCQIRRLDKALAPLRLFQARVVLRAAVKGFQRNETTLFLKQATSEAIQFYFQYVDGKAFYEPGADPFYAILFGENSLGGTLEEIFENAKPVVNDALAQMLSKGVSLKGLSALERGALATII